MKELNLLNGKVGQARFSIEDSNIEMPEKAYVCAASLKYAYVDQQKTDEVTKISLECVDAKTAVVASREGLDLGAFPTFTCEIEDAELVASLKGQFENFVGKQLSTRGANLALKWVRSGDRGSWNGLKLILNKPSFTQATEK